MGKKGAFTAVFYFVHLTSRSHSGNFFLWAWVESAFMGLVQVALMTICPWCAKHGAPSLVSPGGASLPLTCTEGAQPAHPWPDHGTGQGAARGSRLVCSPWKFGHEHHGNRNPVLRWVCLVMAWYRTILLSLVECVHKLLSSLCNCLFLVKPTKAKCFAEIQPVV